MEYLILNNLDAAIKDEPKPALFGPTAGRRSRSTLGGGGAFILGGGGAFILGGGGASILGGARESGDTA